MKEYGTGSDLHKAAQALTGALTALAGNNLAGALASGASPYLATEIKKRVGEDNVAANAMAHAVLGAVTAQLNNQSGVAGGLGAGGGELAARYIAGQLFPGKKASELSESEKQQVSALSQLAAGLAGGLATGDTAGGVTAAQTGKNAVENNLLGAIAGGVAEGAVVAGGVGHGSQSSNNADEAWDADDGSYDPSKSREENARNSEKQNITVEDLTSTSSKGNETTGRSKLFERTGGSNAANKEFDALSPTEIKDIPGGRVGKLPDGRMVIVRERSTDGRPTLEIQSGKNRIKFRYDE